MKGNLTRANVPVLIKLVTAVTARATAVKSIVLVAKSKVILATMPPRIPARIIKCAWATLEFYPVVKEYTKVSSNIIFTVIHSPATFGRTFGSFLRFARFLLAQYLPLCECVSAWVSHIGKHT